MKENNSILADNVEFIIIEDLNKNKLAEILSKPNKEGLDIISANNITIRIKYR